MKHIWIKLFPYHVRSMTKARGPKGHISCKGVQRATLIEGSARAAT